jgi:hypothetical protein
MSQAVKLRRRSTLTFLDGGFFFALCGGQIADVITTNVGLHRGIVELNSLISLTQTYLGSPWWLPKCALVILSGTAVLVSEVPRLLIALVIVGTWVPPMLNMLELIH